MGFIKGDTRSLAYGSFGTRECLENPLDAKA